MAELMYEMDQELDIRKPRKSPSANKIYEEVLKMPSGEQSQALLQTTFTERGRY
jgi:hypothetical protein